MANAIPVHSTPEENPELEAIVDNLIGEEKPVAKGKNRKVPEAAPTEEYPKPVYQNGVIIRYDY